MRLCFLGTGGSWPTRERNVTSICVSFGPTSILLDCGEGTQRQLLDSPVSPMKITAVLVTHLHGDHFLGIPGLIQTMSMNERTEILTIIGPKGISSSMNKALSMCPFTLRFPVEVLELADGGKSEISGLSVKARSVDHGRAEALAYRIDEPMRPGRFNRERAEELGIPEGPLWGRLQKGETVRFDRKGKEVEVDPSEVLGPPRKGLSLAYSGDTAPCEAMRELSESASVLIHEATYGDELKAMASEWGHSTAREAAHLAREAGVGKLFLVHTSPRYSDRRSVEVLVNEANSEFPEVILPDDGEIFEISR